jgi:hypothetical protein
MDDLLNKLKRKIIPKDEVVISPAEREQRLRQMLGYEMPKDIDPEFAIDVPDDSGDEEFGIKSPLELEPQRPMYDADGNPTGKVDQMARYKKKKAPNG